MNLTNFVLFRYPGELAYEIVDEKGPDNFLFVDFLREHPISISGIKRPYVSNREIDFSSDVQAPFISTKAEYSNQFHNFQSTFENSNVRKAILSRIVEVNVKSIGLHTIFKRLCTAYPGAMVYLANLGEHGVWAGATPERLIKVTKGEVHTVALAGTKKSANPSDWGVKEKHEHREVESYIEDISTEEDFLLKAKSPVYIKQAGQVFHLKSDFVFEMTSENIPRFLAKLHPTPAVCGVPLKESRALILNTEKHQRSFYTGYLGLESKGDENQAFEYFVNLRCMQIIGRKAYLYVGGGITPESTMESEWQETIDKSQTLASVIQ